jgi:hypothetical protein
MLGALYGLEAGLVMFLSFARPLLVLGLLLSILVEADVVLVRDSRG